MVHDKRINHLQEVLQDCGLAGATLFYSRDIFYYTGTAQPSYFLVLPKDHMLFVRKGYEFARRECGLEAERVVPESSIKTMCQQMFPGVGTREKVGTELDVLTVAQSRLLSRGPLASGPNLRQTSGTVYTITGIGLSSAVPAGPSLRIMEPGDLVVVDIPACVDGYHADQSHTYAVHQIPGGALDLFSRLREISDFLINSMSPGMTTGEAFALAEDHAMELDLGRAFMGFESQANAHFVGHGIGLELNEPPLLIRDGDVLLEQGMVLAIEMHAMIPGGLTVKLEDTVHLTDEGVQLLTTSPRELILVN